jgi:hypothetical protein
MDRIRHRLGSGWFVVVCADAIVAIGFPFGYSPGSTRTIGNRRQLSAALAPHLRGLCDVPPFPAYGGTLSFDQSL